MSVGNKSVMMEESPTSGLLLLQERDPVNQTHFNTEDHQRVTNTTDIITDTCSTASTAATPTYTVVDEVTKV